MAAGQPGRLPRATHTHTKCGCAEGLVSCVPVATVLVFPVITSPRENCESASPWLSCLFGAGGRPSRGRPRAPCAGAWRRQDNRPF